MAELTSPEHRTGSDTILQTRLANWVNERGEHSGEREARVSIGQALLAELSHQEISARARIDLRHFSGIINQLEKNLSRFQKTRERYEYPGVIVDLHPEEGRRRQIIGTNPENPLYDSVTGQPFLTRIVRETDAWVAEELRQDGQTISRARIFDDTRQPQLSLHFTDEHYQGLGAVVDITDSDQCPETAKLVFVYLAKALQGKLKKEQAKKSLIVSF